MDTFDKILSNKKRKFLNKVYQSKILEKQKIAI